MHLFWGNWGLSNTCRVAPYSGSSPGSFHLAIRGLALQRSLSQAITVSMLCQQSLANLLTTWYPAKELQKPRGEPEGWLRQAKYISDRSDPSVKTVTCPLYMVFSRAMYLPALCLPVSSREQPSPSSDSGAPVPSRCFRWVLPRCPLPSAADPGLALSEPACRMGPPPGFARLLQSPPGSTVHSGSSPERLSFSGTVYFFPPP